MNDMEQALTAVTARALRSDIAARHGISAEDRDLLLTGSDEATLTAQAERLAAWDTASRLSRANVARREGQVVGIRRTGEQEEMREFASQLFDTDDPFA
ncbi:hypothetical protein [Microbacterium laevaniformans]|uniref:hypothetical protein n=1 Tax=Microbacterium laevaniformans TaxID=36807 RepID=UPI00362E809C